MSKARNLSDFISDPTISSTEIADQAVTHPKLHGTMDLSSKTVTLPSLSQTIVNSSHIQMGGNLDVVGQIGAYDNPGSSWGKMILRATDFELKNAGGTINMVLDTSGNVGIGTSSPSSILHTNNTADAPNGITIQNSSASGSADSYVQFKTSSADVIMGIDATGTDVFKISNSTALGTSDVLTIDPSGNVLVGTTDATPYDNTSGNGILLGDGLISSAQSGGNAAIFNRMTNDGSIVNFRKDGTSVGSIAANGGSIIVGSGDTGLYFDAASDRLIPVNPATASGRDNAVNLGGGSERFKDLYLSGGVYLGGTGSANKLDDYEEGTWTPTIAGLNNTPTYYNNYGKYTKVGRKVTIQFFQQTNSLPTFSNNSAVFRITGIPFTCDGSGYTGSQGSMNSQGFYFNGSSNNQVATGQVAASVGNDGGLALSFSVTHSGGTRGLVNNGAAGSGYIIEATVTYFTTQ